MASDELLLHHYEESPFSEKIRRILAFKGLPWRSVLQPNVMPKPDQMALTGGYRRAPVLQIGADVYCDTALIAETLEALQPAPALVRPETEALARSLADWCDGRFFRVASTAVFQSPGGASASRLSRRELVAVMKDRKKMMEQANVMAVPPELAPEYLAGQLAPFDRQLQAAGPFLTGAEAGIADFSLYHSIWFLRENGAAGEIMQRFPALDAWRDRIASLPDTRGAELSSAEALELARASESKPPENARVDHSALRAGDRVSVSPTDYGFEAAEGELEFCADNRITLRRRDERVGEVRVHFPIYGYNLSPADEG